MEYYTKELDAQLWEDFESYFEHKGSCSGCWCMNHRMPLGLDFEGEAAKLAMKQLVQTNRVFGVLAYTEGDKVPVGWVSLDRMRTLPGHDCIGEEFVWPKDYWSIHCVTSRADHKNKGVEKLLTVAATNYAKKMQATKVESYPEPNSDEQHPFKTWNTFKGFNNSFEELGFQKGTREQGEEKIL